MFQQPLPNQTFSAFRRDTIVGRARVHGLAEVDCFLASGRSMATWLWRPENAEIAS